MATVKHVTKWILTIKTKMAKQWNVREKKRPNIFMEYTTISGSKDIFSVKRKMKTATALKKKLSLGTPVALTLKMAFDTSVVVGDQLQELHLLGVAKAAEFGIKWKLKL